MSRKIAALLPLAIVFGMACSAQAQSPDSRVNPAIDPKAPRLEIPGPAAVAPRVTDPKAAQARMDELLVRWEQKSSTIKSLDAKFIREDEAKSWGEKTTYIGRAILKSPNLAFLDFQKVEDNALVPDQQIRCTGQQVYLYRNKDKQIHIYPLPKQEQQRALEEGPLPFLFNMRAAEAKKRYYMIFHSETLTDYVIRIQPRLEIDRQEFMQADILLDKEKLLPSAIRLYAPNGKETRTFRFKDNQKLGTYINPNAQVNEDNFKGRTLKGWDVVVHKEDEGQPQGAVGARIPKGATPGR